jgi:NAD(P)-dependent dehydrogenase (short-subunit alcohol dehydrogenase family)
MADTSYSLEDKRVLVTGASVGIGAAVARCFAEAGATVGICARRQDQLDEVLADCRRHAPASQRWVIDLADLTAIGDFAKRVEDELGGVDVLVNNAGVPKRRHVRDLRLDEVDDVMALNYLSPVHLTLALLPGMLARGEGRIVNVASIAARLSPPREASYAATKAALTAFTECMAVDLVGTGVSVHLVFPGVIDTDLFHLPDNEESLSDLEALPASAMAEAMRRQIEEGALELYFPAWFADVAKGKAADVPGFLAGTIEWVRQREQQLGKG